MRVVLPFRGELGIVIRFHVPTVAAMSRPIVVCHEPGMEALYPDCERVIVERAPDAGRAWNKAMDTEFRAAERERLAGRFPGARFWEGDGRASRVMHRFVPEPFESQVADEFDVFVCPRKRETGAARNWDGWPTLTDRLRADGLSVFAGGLRDTSYEVDASDAAWHYARPLDACIEAMKRARVVVATDSGLAHLAVLCGRPLVIVAADGGRCAPGKRVDEDNPHWPVRMQRYYRDANHTGSPLDMVPDGWSDLDAVVEATDRLIAVAA